MNHSATSAGSRTRVLPVVQYVRGAAATLVVFSHCWEFAFRNPGDDELTNPLSFYGGLGVAVFFIISGFIMYYTCASNWEGSVRSARDFLSRRFHRIIPLYWVMTLATFAVIMAARSYGGDNGQHANVIGLPELGKSLLFIPYHFTGEKFRPVLGVGWTLDFEMFFYLIFAAGLLFRKQAGLAFIAAVILGTIAVGALVEIPFEPLEALAQPIIFLFLFGIFLGWFQEKCSFRMSERSAVIILAVIFLLTPALYWLNIRTSQLNPDPALWAFAAAIVIPAILSHSARADEEHGLARFGLQMGDASYLLYLAHPVIMMVIGPISMRLHLPTQGTGVIMFVSSIIGALIGHQIFEKRLLKWTAPIFRKRPKAHH